MTGDQRIDAIVRGRVQGVGFRFFVLRVASGLGLDGWVANEPDGSVRIRAEGASDALADFLAELRVGPSGARVDDIETRWSGRTGELGPFAVRSRAHPGD